jgi:hypothetical protein
VSADDEDDVVFGSEFADTLDGGTGADDLTGGSGRDAFRIEANSSGTDSSTDDIDQITDFTLATARWSGSIANNDVTEFQSLTIGGAEADILDINLVDAMDEAITLSVVADIDDLVDDGVLAIDDLSLADAIELANDTAVDPGEALVFEHDGSSYVFVQNGDDDVLVELTGLTGVAGLDVLGTGITGGANWVIIG